MAKAGPMVPGSTGEETQTTWSEPGLIDEYWESRKRFRKKCFCVKIIAHYSTFLFPWILVLVPVSYDYQIHKQVYLLFYLLCIKGSIYI